MTGPPNHRHNLKLLQHRVDHYNILFQPDDSYDGAPKPLSYSEAATT